MLRALWFFIQLSIIVVAAVWLLSQRGTVDIVWNEYSVSGNLGIFLLVAVVIAIVAVGLLRLIGAIVNAPEKFSRRRVEKNRRKGFQALTRGFVAIAAGDAKKASGFARDVRRLLPDETGLPLLLEAQAARLRGDEGDARQSFEKLLHDKDAAFFGVRGLLKSSIDAGDPVGALAFARIALDKNPKQPWVLKTVYELELENKHWNAAMQLLDRARKQGAIEKDRARKDEIALLHVLAEEHRLARDENGEIGRLERALKLDPHFVPTVLRLGEIYLEKNKKGKAVSLVEKAWKVNPHPDLAALWEKLSPDASADPLRRVRWFEKLAVLRPDSADAQIAVAKAAMDCGLSGEAKAYLTTAEHIRPTARLYRLRADVEEVSTHNAALVRGWLDKAATASPDSVWYCALSGNIYDRWSPVALPHGSFNTIEWGIPIGGTKIVSRPLDGWTDKDPLMIETL